MQATWKPHEKHGELTERGDLPDSVFAFPHQRKEPMTDASHVRDAIARFDQTVGVSDEDRELAFANIKRAAEHYGVDMTETKWSELGAKPKTGRTTQDRKVSARKGGGDPQAARRVKIWRGAPRLGSTPSNGCALKRRRHGTSTPGFITPTGSRARFAAASATPKRAGRCSRYQGMWSRPMAW